jgi:hypothetical protein
VTRYAPQPAAEGFAGAIAAEIWQSNGDGLEHLLAHILRVGPLYAPVPTPVRDQRRVQVEQALPGIPILIAGALQ